uniref:Uncharacterized protein n=1 Tax=Cucumis melo TaxID=3656 RepID=A0A9I9EDF8_CUCME
MNDPTDSDLIERTPKSSSMSSQFLYLLLFLTSLRLSSSVTIPSPPSLFYGSYSSDASLPNSPNYPIMWQKVGRTFLDVAVPIVWLITVATSFG